MSWRLVQTYVVGSFLGKHLKRDNVRRRYEKMCRFKIQSFERIQANPNFRDVWCLTTSRNTIRRPQTLLLIVALQEPASRTRVHGFCVREVQQK